MTMKTLIAMLLLISATYAAPPPIYPGEPGAASLFPTVLAEGDACVVVWYYDAGHRWQFAGFGGTGEDCTKLKPQVMTALNLDINDLPSWALSTVVGVRMMALSHAEKDALWNAVFSVHPDDPEYAETRAAAQLKDAAAVALMNKVPQPTTIPPSGLVTIDTRVYKLTGSVDQLTWVLVGTAPIGTVCDTSQKLGQYFRINRDLVKYPSGVLKPLQAFAKCSP